MGRELRRVAANFSHPLNKVWDGFLNPHYKHCRECPSCRGSGYSHEARRLSDMWHGWAPFSPEDRGSVPFSEDTPQIRAKAERSLLFMHKEYGNPAPTPESVLAEARRIAEYSNNAWCHHLNMDDVLALVDAGRLWDFTREFIPGQGWRDKETAWTPNPAEVNLWSLDGIGHDSINSHIVISAECRRLGIESTCSRCSGHGNIWDSETARADSEAWTPQDPPEGPWFQIWETVSEGSPISPAFETALELAQWMSKNADRSFDKGKSVQTWMQFISGPGWAPSFAGTSAGLVDGVDFAAAEFNPTA